MNNKAADLTKLTLAKLKTLQEDPAIGLTEEWTVKRTSEDIRRLLGPVFCQCVEEIVPGIVPDKRMQISLDDWRRTCEVLLRRHSRVSGQETVPVDPLRTLDAPARVGENQKVRFSVDAITAEIPVRNRSWREFKWDIERKCREWWKRLQGKKIN